MELKKLNYYFKCFREYFIAFIALSGPAFIVNSVNTPLSVVSGELTGVCQIIYFLFSTPIWLSSLLLNLILLGIAIKLMGWKFCANSVFGILTMSFWLKVFPILSTPAIENPFIAIVLAAIINGVGLGVCFMYGLSSGGTDIIGLIVHHYKKVNIGNVLFCCDLVIISCSYFLPQVKSLYNCFLGLLFTFTSNCCVNLITSNRTLKKYFKNIFNFTRQD